MQRSPTGVVRMSAYAISLDSLGEHMWVLMPVKGILLSNTSMDALKLVKIIFHSSFWLLGSSEPN